MSCPSCGAPFPAKGQMGRLGFRIQIPNHPPGAPRAAHFLQIPAQPCPGARQGRHCDWSAFACGFVTISQFGIGLVSISQFTVAAYALAQFAFAYSLIAQLGIYIHEGHGQVVKSLGELVGML